MPFAYHRQYDELHDLAIARSHRISAGGRGRRACFRCAMRAAGDAARPRPAPVAADLSRQRNEFLHRRVAEFLRGASISTRERRWRSRPVEGGRASGFRSRLRDLPPARSPPLRTRLPDPHHWRGRPIARRVALFRPVTRHRVDLAQARRCVFASPWPRLLTGAGPRSGAAASHYRYAQFTAERTRGVAGYAGWLIAAPNGA